MQLSCHNGNNIHIHESHCETEDLGEEKRQSSETEIQIEDAITMAWQNGTPARKADKMSDYRGIAPMCFSGNIAENWKAWRQRFENYLIASEVSKKDQKIQIAQLLHYIGEEGMTIFNTFAFEADEERHKLKIVLEKLDKCQPTLKQFVTGLKNKARSCEFGELKDSLMKDMLTCGLANTKLCEQLLEDDEKTLEEAIKFCLAVEKSKEQSVSMGMSNDVTKDGQGLKKKYPAV
nr:unnamed protein product [Callosobruchus analis]